MIDLHSHILAGIDDGPSTIGGSLSLIKDSLDKGVVKILVTPHIHHGTFDNDLSIIKTEFDKLTQTLQENKIQVSVAYAAEIRICPEIIMLAKTNQLPFMGKWQDKDLLLIEFPHSHIPPGSDKLIDWLIKNNIQPMIAHPERNRDLWQYSECLQPFINKGCLFQITAASLLGDFGEIAKKISWDLIESNTATIVASDMHSLKRRPNKMLEAYQMVEQKFGKVLSDKLFISTPDTIFKSNPTIWALS